MKFKAQLVVYAKVGLTFFLQREPDSEAGRRRHPQFDLHEKASSSSLEADELGHGIGGACHRLTALHNARPGEHPRRSWHFWGLWSVPQSLTAVGW